MSSLYQISEELLALDALLYESEGEVTPEIEAWLTEYGDALAQKVDSTGGYIRSCEARAKAITEEVQRLQQRKTVEENKVASVKKLLELVMLRLDRPKLTGNLFTIARQKNGGRPALTVNEEALHVLPEAFFVMERKILKEELREYLVANGGILRDNDTVVAELQEPGYSVRIR